MIFTSYEFAIFFLAVLAVRGLIRSHNGEKWFLLLASYVFYMSWGVPWVLILIFTSYIDYWLGRRLGSEERLGRRRMLLVTSLVLNLGTLGFFKYTNFLLGTGATALGWFGYAGGYTPFDIILPLGISFFTFQSMSYTIDVYRRQLQPCTSLRDFLLYVAFFPQLVAGPIVRAQDFLPQLNDRRRARSEEVESGLAQFGLGATKKLVFSDQVAPHVDLIFANPAAYDGPTLLLGVLGYAVQIYCDFSGYSDMAIGSARIMGFHFIENFQMPYSARTVTEFWRRWHISLSTWLRDYLYIPLGGNRRGIPRMYLALILTMLLGGLWHGASWNFVAWGALHGLALAVHKAWTMYVPDRWRAPVGFAWLTGLLSRGLTLSVVLVGWVLFRAQTWSDAQTYLARIFTWTQDGTRLVSPYILAAVAGVALVHLIVPKDFNWAARIAERPTLYRTVSYAAVLTILVCFAATDATPFIYFQF